MSAARAGTTRPAPPHPRVPLARQFFPLTAQIADQRPRFGTLGIGEGVIRIKPDRLVEMNNSLAIVLEIAPLKIDNDPGDKQCGLLYSGLLELQT